MRTRRRKWIGVGTLGLLGIMLVIGLALRSSERRLLILATPVLQMTDNDFFAWLSEREVLLYQSVHGEGGFRLSRLDLVTHQETPLPELTKLFNRYNGYPEAGQVSPDGKCLLWTGHIGTNQKRMSQTDFRAVCATLEGKPLAVAPVGSWLATDALVANSLRWMPDGKHWLEFYPQDFAGNSLILYSLDKPQEQKTLTLSSPYKGASIDALYITPERILAAEEPFFLGRNRLPMLIQEFPLVSPAASAKTYSLKLPAEINKAEDSFVWSFSIAPKTNSMAWVVGCETTNTWRQFLHRFLPHLSVPVEEVLSLRVVRLDGTQEQEIGYIVQDPNADKNPVLRHLQWSPEGKHLGFLYGGKLYVKE